MDSAALNEVRTVGAGSFSRLEAFEKCPHRTYLEFIVRSPKPPPESAEHIERAARGVRIHKLAEDYVKGADDLDLTELKKIRPKIDEFRALYAEGRAAVEQEWAYGPEWEQVGWFDPHVWLRVKQDVALYPGESRMEVYDYKTGKKHDNEVKHIQQGQLYALSAFMRFPATEELDVDFLYVDHGVNLRRKYKRADVPRLLATWSRRLTALTSATAFPARPNRMHCRYCPFGPNNGGTNVCGYGVQV